MKYRVAQDSNYADFTKEVNDALADGWTLQGGICVVERRGSDGKIYETYYQALVK